MTNEGTDRGGVGGVGGGGGGEGGAAAGGGLTEMIKLCGSD